MIKTIVKRDGRKEAYSAAKLNEWGIWAAKDLDPNIVNWSSVIMRVVSTLPEEVTAKHLQEALIKNCVDRDTYEHQKMAGRLYASSIPKDLYSERVYPDIKDLHKEMIAAGVIVKPNYTASEYKKINKMLRHELDLTYAYYALHQAITRYSLQNRKTGKIYESPQFIYMRVAMQALNSYHEEDRMFKLKELYDLLCERKINIPTPYYSNSLTANPNVASCAVLHCEDTADSIGIMNSLMYNLTTLGAGIGSHSSIRSLGDEVRGGLIKHEGIVPYLKMFGATIKSSKQGCLLSDAEIYVEKRGRICINQYKKGDKILQPSAETPSILVYAEPKKYLVYENQPDSEFFVVNSTNGNIDFEVTAEHRIIYFGYDEQLDEYVERECLAKDFDELVTNLDDNDVIGFPVFVERNLNENSMFHIEYFSKEDLYVTKTSHPSIKNVYCFETESGKFVTRINERNIITGNSRGGSATHYIPFYNPEIITVLNLKNPMTPVAKRVRELDYGICVNKYFLQKAAKNENIYLFSVKDAPHLDAAFYSKQDPMEWGKSVEAFALAHPDKVQEIPAQDVLKEILKQSLEVGRIYLSFIDEMNRHTPYKEPIHSSNLCCFSGSETLLVKVVEGDSEGVHTVTFKELTDEMEKNKNKTFYIRSFNEELQREEYKRITASMLMRKHEKIYRMRYLHNGKEKVLHLTDNHALLTKDGEILEVGKMQTGTELEAGAEYAEFIRLEYLKRGDVYDIEVEDNHNFFIGGIVALNCEISLPNQAFKSYKDLYDEDIDREDMGSVAFCNLAGIVVDNIQSDEEYSRAAYYALLMIDAGIENSELKFPSLNASIRAYRSAGVGILGLAHLMAEKGLSYRSREGKAFMHELAETHAYHLYSAALQLAKERGVAKFMYKTEFPKGWLPIDTYNKNVDEIVPNNLKRDWESLRKEIIETGGIRFTTVGTIPPAESSSVITETTNAIYPTRDLTVVKTSGSTSTRWVAPNATKLKDKYEIVWKIPNKDIIEMYAIFQKFLDQGISCDLWVDRSTVGNVKMSTMMQEVFWMGKYGVKGRYYYNSKTEADLDLNAAIAADVTKAKQENPSTDKDESEAGCEGCTL